VAIAPVTAGASGTAEEVTAPVICGGLVMPAPFRIIVTGEPAAAGLAQLLTLPSGLNARLDAGDALPAAFRRRRKSAR
jgi:hypothetical protein